MYNYAKLRGRIVEICGTHMAFGKAIGISRAALSLKLNNRNEFSQGEIKKALDVLGLSKDDAGEYFFTLKS